jgi:hypothetical protein
MCSAAARPTIGPGIVPFLVTYRNSATLEPLWRAPGPVEHEAGYELVLVLPSQTVTRIMAARPHSGEAAAVLSARLRVFMSLTLISGLSPSLIPGGDACRCGWDTPPGPGRASPEPPDSDSGSASLSPGPAS